MPLRFEAVNFQWVGFGILGSEALGLAGLRLGALDAQGEHLGMLNPIDLEIMSFEFWSYWF